MPRVKKNAQAMKGMCERLRQVLQHVYAGDTAALSEAMGYASEATLRKALSSGDTFPDLERFNALMKHPAKGCVVPNLNWLVNGIEQPLLQIQNGRVVKQLTFGNFVDFFLSGSESGD